MTFGEAIIKLRSERRISQRQLAEELNVSFTSRSEERRVGKECLA